MWTIKKWFDHKIKHCIIDYRGNSIIFWRNIIIIYDFSRLLFLSRYCTSLRTKSAVCFCTNLKWKCKILHNIKQQRKKKRRYSTKCFLCLHLTLAHTVQHKSCFISIQSIISGKLSINQAIGYGYHKNNNNAFCKDFIVEIVVLVNM